MKAFHKFNQFNPYENKSLGGMNIAEEVVRKESKMFGDSTGGLAALEAFQRDYLSPGSRGESSQLGSSQPATPATLPPTPPRAASSSPAAAFQPNPGSFEEQFKELYEFNTDPTRKSFLDDLFSFMHNRGTPINRLPIMAKQVLDLYELYNLVVEKGGLVEVINKKQWQEIIKGLHLPQSITSAAFTLRSQYTRYLYPYECREKNLSNPSELHSAIESHRREGRRQGYEGLQSYLPPSSQHFPPNSSSLPLPQFPLFPPPRMGLGQPPLMPGTPPGFPGMNHMDITRFALMKMMGGGRLPFPGAPPPLDLAKERGEEERREREEEEEEEERRYKEEGGRRTVQERTIDCKDFEDSSINVKASNNNENRMVVSLELNSVTYQGVLFAQPIEVNQSHSIQR